MKPLRDILLKRHRSVEPKLDRMWIESLAPELRGEPAPEHRNVLLAAGLKLWGELIWPSRRVWAGLACVWVLLIVWNVSTSEPAPRVIAKAEPQSAPEIQALVERQRMLAQLVGPLSEPANARKLPQPGPHSERSGGVSAA